MTIATAGNAGLALARRGEAGARLTTEAVGPLHTIHPEHRTAAVGADHLDAAGAGLADLDQLAQAVDIQHRRARKQAHHLHLGGGLGAADTRQQTGNDQVFKASHGAVPVLSHRGSDPSSV